MSNYNFKDIEKIEKFSSWSQKQKLDELLRIDCSLYAHLGIDSTQTDREEVKKKSKKIYKTIKNLNPTVGNLFLTCMDSTI
tara:strand:- start:1285 stop:1527 length:243 start_codon:yes stop_codon:yes gene_type:complete